MLCVYAINSRQHTPLMNLMSCLSSRNSHLFKLIPLFTLTTLTDPLIINII